MSDLVWLASYPKSGNTWFRMLVASLSVEDGNLDINRLPESAGLAGDRAAFDAITLIESALLLDEEIDCLRPRVYEALAKTAVENRATHNGPRLMKVHDAYVLTPKGEPLLKGADAAIVIVRDPRDVAVSLAHHTGRSIDDAIAFMATPNAAFGANGRGQPSQIRQTILSWKDHVASWLDQQDIPIYLARYEDMSADTVRVFRTAMQFAGRDVSPDEAARAVKLASFGNLQAQERAAGFGEHLIAQGLFFREGRVGGWRQQLTTEQASRIEKDHESTMARMGYLHASASSYG